MKTRKLQAEDDGTTIAGELLVAGRTDVGRERKRNEDQFLIASLQRNLFIQDSSLPEEASRWLPAGQQGTIMLVADGMGGGAQGDVASRVAVKAIAAYLCDVIPWASNATADTVPRVSKAPDAPDNTAETSGQDSAKSSRSRTDTLLGVRIGLASALAKGDEQVRRAAEEHDAQDRMGTTVTMAYVIWPKLYVAHVGDSRCYLLRDHQLKQLTTDHTFAEKLRASNNIDIDESSPWHHVLWNVVGGAGESSFEPELYRRTLRAGDMLLLCSDGLTKHVTDEELVEALEEKSLDPDGVCKWLVQLANERGGTDNITVVVARCVGIRGAESDVGRANTEPDPAKLSEAAAAAKAAAAAEAAQAVEASGDVDDSEAPTRVKIRAESD